MLNTIATYGICNDMAINVKDIDYGINDKIIWCWSNSNKLHKSKIYYSRKGEYIIINKIRFYLNDFIRINL